MPPPAAPPTGWVVDLVFALARAATVLPLPYEVRSDLSSIAAEMHTLATVAYHNASSSEMTTRWEVDIPSFLCSHAPSTKLAFGRQQWTFSQGNKTHRIRELLCPLGVRLAHRAYYL